MQRQLTQFAVMKTTALGLPAASLREARRLRLLFLAVPLSSSMPNRGIENKKCSTVRSLAVIERGPNDVIQPKLFSPRRECPAVGGLQRSRHSLAAAVRFDVCAGCPPLLCPPTNTAVGTTWLDSRLCDDQWIAILASFHGASSCPANN
jgi:hypothetical protein